MKVMRYIHIDHHESWKLRDLVSIERDFQRCAEMCASLAQGLDPITMDACIIDALATAIPVVYARPFNGGIRMRVEEILALYDDTEKGHHQVMLDIRSKFAAHSINKMENQQLRVWLTPREKGQEIQVTAEFGAILALATGDYLLLNRMCRKAVEWTRQQQATESERLRLLLLEAHTMDEIYSMEAKVVESHGKEAASRARKQR